MRSAADRAATAAARAFARRGEAAFRAADYASAVHDWRHAVVDDPYDPGLLLLLSQGIFATGKFDEAADAAQEAMRSLKVEEWGSVISRYHGLYGRAEDYSDQLRALETAVKAHPDDPALRFLMGYHYGYLGFRKQAIDQFDQVLTKIPGDDITRELRDEISGRHIQFPLPPAPSREAPSREAPGKGSDQEETR